MAPTGYDTASSSQGLADAQAAQRRSDLIAGVGKSLSQIATARAQANGYKPDNSVYDDITAQGARGVQQAAQARQQAIQDFLAKRTMGRQDVSDTQTAESHTQNLQKGTQELAQGDLALKTATGHQDPKSRDSQLAVAMVDKQFPKLMAGMTPEQKADLTYDDIKNLGLPAAEVGAKVDANLENSRARLAQTLQLKNDEKDKALGGQYTTRTQKYNADSAKLAGTENLLAEAEKGGGIAGNLVKAESLHAALGRVAQGELGMAQNPGLGNTIDTFLKRTEGKPFSDRDLADYKKITADARKTLDNTYHSDVGTLTDVHDRITHRPAGYSANLLGYKGPAPAAAPGGVSSPSSPTGSPLIEGSTSTSKGRPIIVRNGKWELQ